MNNAAIFKQAHAMTKVTIKAGDSYQATFALCLKLVIEQNKAQAVAVVEAKKKAHQPVKAIIHTIPEAIYQLSMGAFCVVILSAFVMFTLHVATNTPHAWLSVVGGFVGTGAILMEMFIVSEAIENVHSEVRHHAL